VRITVRPAIVLILRAAGGRGQGLKRRANEAGRELG
jgi:hypothetical protein